MGRLVLGILAVIVLQVAFFGYMAMDRLEYANAPVASRTPASEIARSFPSSKPFTSSTSSAPIVGDTVSEPSELKSRARAEQLRPAARFKGHGRVQIKSRKYTGRSPVQPAFARPSYDYQPVPLKDVTITYRQYSSALTDYPKKPAPEKISVAKRKRPLLARVFTPIVKKPWRWMKSVASKLN